MQVKYPKKRAVYLSTKKQEIGEVLNDEIVTYRYPVFGANKTTLTFDLNVEYGNPDMYVKLC